MNKMVAPKLTAWKRSNQGTIKDFGAAIDKYGINAYPYACSFISKNGRDVDFQNTETGEATSTYGNQKNIAVGKDSTAIVYISGDDVKLKLIVDEAYNGSVYDLPHLAGTNPVYGKSLHIVYVESEEDIDEESYLVSWLSKDDVSGAGKYVANFAHLVFYTSDGGQKCHSERYSATYSTTDYVVFLGTPMFDYSDPDYTDAYYPSARVVGGAAPSYSLIKFIINVNTSFGGTGYTSVSVASNTNKTLRGVSVSDTYQVVQEEDITGAPFSDLAYSSDFGINRTVFGGTNEDYILQASRNGFIYVTKSNGVYKGTITDATPDTIAWELITYYGTDYTFLGLDVSDTDILIVLKDASYEYMLLLNDITEIGLSSAVIDEAINSSKGNCEIKCADNTNIYETVGDITIYDRNSVKVFRGYYTPSSSKFTINLEGIERELLNRMTNRSFAAKTLNFMADAILSDDSVMEIGNNALPVVVNYTQQWSNSVPQHIALETLGAMGIAFYRNFVDACDFYTIAAPSSSGKKIIFGTTSAVLEAELINEIDQINKLVIFGAYVADTDGAATAGVLQITFDDEIDQNLNGIKPLYLRRHDLETYDAVLAYGTEVWTRRKSTEDNIFVYKVKLFGTTFFKAGDTIAIENASFVSENMVDTDYFIIRAQVDVVQEWTILWLCTSISPTQNVYNDLLTLSAQSPLESAADSTQGDQTTKISITELVGGGQSAVVAGGGTEYGDVAAFADHEYAGITVECNVSQTVVLGDWVYINTSGNARLAKSNAIATSYCIGVCVVGAATGSDATILIDGVIRDDSFVSQTPGKPVYLSSTTVGDIATAPPSANGYCVSIVGNAIAEKIILVKPSPMIIEIIA